MSGRVFLGWTSTKQGLMCLAQGNNAVPPVRLEPQPFDLESSPLPLSHCTPHVGSLDVILTRRQITKAIIQTVLMYRLVCAFNNLHATKSGFLASTNKIKLFIIQVVWFYAQNILSLLQQRALKCIAALGWLNYGHFVIALQLIYSSRPDFIKSKCFGHFIILLTRHNHSCWQGC